MTHDRPQDILLPVRASTIVLSFSLALLANFLPWPDPRLVPDFVALVLVFWCVRAPRRVGLGVGWAIGLITDAGSGLLLGQNALVYSLVAFFALALSRRILWFGLGQQALHVVALLVFAESVSVLIRLAAGDAFPGWSILAGPVLAALLWPVITWLLLLPQRAALDPET